MALIVETGAGVTDANSWVDLEFADLYHASLGNTAWAPSGSKEEDREALLLKAVRTVIVPRYAGKWIGDIYSDSQSLPWPRGGYHDPEGRWIRGPFVPDEVKFLQCEVALNFLVNPEYDTPQRRGVTIESEKIGPITTVTQYDSAQSPVLTTPKVSRLVRALLDVSCSQVRIVRS